MGLFSRCKHQLVPKASCDDPKPSPSFCLPIVATVAKGVAYFIWSPCPSAPVGVLYLFVCRSAAKGSLRKIKVISTTQKSIQILYIIQKNPPEKIAQKMGVARDCHAHCRDGDWLTEAPVFQNGGGSGSWHKSTRDPNSPGVNHPHDTNPSSPP